MARTQPNAGIGSPRSRVLAVHALAAAVTAQP
jgi:hypothetical protein